MGIFYLLLEIVVKGTRDVCGCVYIFVCVYVRLFFFFVFMVEWVENFLFIDCNFYF